MKKLLFAALFTSVIAFGGQTKNIIDMTGRSIAVPVKVEKVVTAGATPAVNAFLFALGKADTIQNGMPGFMAGKSWKYQGVFAPKTASQIVVSGPGPDWNVNAEALAGIPHDVAFVANKASADMLAQKGFCVVSLYWSDSESIKKTATLLGDIMGVKERAKAYTDYYDDTLKKVASRVSTQKNKPKALYIRFKNLSLPMVSTATWMFENAGAINVAKGVKDHANVSAEQIIGWNPDFLFVWGKDEVEAVYKDTRFKSLNAIKNKKVFAVPTGAHVWTHYTPEQPLAVIWAAEKFYPSKFSDINIRKVVFDFYSNFFGYKLSEEQISDILNP